jgi:hypothetical protein
MKAEQGWDARRRESERRLWCRYAVRACRCAVGSMRTGAPLILQAEKSLGSGFPLRISRPLQIGTRHDCAME